MAYSHITWAQLQTALANRLGDPLGIFWPVAEVKAYLAEALRTWNAMAYYHRARSGNLSVSTTFTDIHSVVSQTALTLTDRDLIADLQRSLMEPVSPLVWAGSDQFSLDDLVKALEQKRNEFLFETWAVLSNITVAASSDRVTLPDTVLSVRRAAWKTSAGAYSPLWREDEWAFIAGPSGSIPSAYSILLTPPVTMQLSSVPAQAGTLDLVVVLAPAALNPAAGVLLNVPDDLAWVVKWGALARLLTKDARAADPLRAAYAAQRFREGILVARAMPRILQVNVGGSVLYPSTLFELDATQPAWQTTAGTSTAAGADMNLLTLAPPPLAATTVILDVLRNAPIPATDAGPVQIGREHINAILDYALHLAYFKVGGKEFTDTIPLYQGFVQAAASYNSKLAASGIFDGELARVSLKGIEQVPEREEAGAG